METTVNHDNDLPTMTAKNKERDRIDAQTAEFLGRGGSISRIETGVSGGEKSYFTDPKSKISDSNRANAQSAKHRYMLSKETAIENGRPTFIGMQCKTCNGYERWTKYGSCIVCKPEPGPHPKTVAGNARQLAAQKLEPTYCGQPCKECGATERDTQTGKCIANHRDARCHKRKGVANEKPAA